MQESRLAMAQRLQGDKMAILNLIFGYPQGLTYDDFLQAYKRIGLCKRIIKLNVDFTWRSQPEIVADTEDVQSRFNRLRTKLKKMVGVDSIQSAINKLDRKHGLYKELKRADTLACIGRYSVLVIGTKDSEDLTRPLQKGSGIGDIAFFKAYDEKQAQIDAWVTDKNSPRFGLPETYRISGPIKGEKENLKYRVHHSRVIHIADDLVDSDFYGTPKLEAPFNYVYDIYKIIGSAAEVFWLGAYQGLVFSKESDRLITDDSVDDMKQEIEEYANKLRRHLIVSGVDVTALPSTSPSPGNTADLLFQLLAAASNIPTRILFGSEQGVLAASTDRDMFLSYIGGRRDNFADCAVLTPLINRLIEYGFIQHKGDFEIKWKPLIERDASERIQDANRMVQTARQFVGQSGEVTDILTREEVRDAMGLDAKMPDTDYEPAGDYSGAMDELPTQEPGSKLTKASSKKRGFQRLKSLWRNRERLKNARKRVRINERWVTMPNGSRVLIGDDGEIKGGLDGKYDGISLDEAFGDKNSEQDTNSEIDYIEGASIEAELQKKSDEAFDTLTRYERRSIDYYTRAHYRDINEHLRGDKNPSAFKQAAVEDRIQAIDSAIGQFQLENDIVVHRGDSSNLYSRLSSGDIITKEAFTSTSLDMSVAQDFAGFTTGHMSEIRVPRGTPSLYIGTNSGAVPESELLLGRGLQYRVIEQSARHTVLEVVL